MSDRWSREAFWWVPVLVALVGGLGWLIKDRVETSRSPGSIVAWSEKPANYLVSVRLDDGEARPAKAHFVRFDDVRPGAHQLEFSSENRQTVVHPLTVKGGTQTVVLFPELPLISGTAPDRPDLPATPSATPAQDRVRPLENRPAGSRLQVTVDGGEALGAVMVMVSSSEGPSVNWANEHLFPGPAELLLSPEASYIVVLSGRFTQAGTQTFRMRVLDANGRALGFDRSVGIQGTPGSTYYRTVLLP